MPTPLQKSKLFLPPARPRLVERPRLLERLDALCSEGSRAALVSAPAGFGKTTLVVQWLERLGWSAGWVALDARDNLPARFFAYLVAALQAAVPGAGNEALALLDLPGVDLEEVVTSLANDLANAARPFVLVLDDLHTITNPALHQALDLFLEAQPPAMRLVLVARQDPPINLSRRRARGQLVEVRQDDLQFNLAEALAFLNQGMDLRLSISQVETLEARTEGWAAGLQLAALSLQRLPDPERFIQEFSGSHRFILDYLVEEVLASQPQEIQDFLLQTSVLERMCAGLCAALTGLAEDEARRQLEQLSRTNLFVIPLDEERQWFRYHHLFGDLLLTRQQEAGPTRTAGLYRLASAWHEQAGEPRQAVEYALKAQDGRLAADLIERHIIARWQTVDFEFYMLVKRLPPEVVAERPALSLNSAWACVINGQVELLPAFLEAAERQLLNPARPSEPADAASRAFARILRAYLNDFNNQKVELDESLEQAFAAIPESNPGMRNSVAVVIGTMGFMEGNFPAALRYFEDALERDLRINGTNAIPIAVMRIAWLLQAQGRLPEAKRRLAEAEATVRRQGIRRFYINGVLNLLQGEILLEWNRLEEAEAQIREGLRLLEDWPVPQVLCLGYSLLARLKLATGDLEAARNALALAEAFTQRGRLYPLFRLAFERARLAEAIARQDRAIFEDWCSQHAPTPASVLSFRTEPELILVCRAWLALGRQAPAAGLLEHLAAAALGRNGSRVLILALLAAARHAQPAAAEAALEEALSLGEPGGYLRTFLEAGEPLRQVLKAWLQRRPARENDSLHRYARQVLAAFERPAAPPAVLPEPLSAREQEVLELMAAGLTNQQIASRLVISIRTVKKHIENIHGKLGVQNRTQAVAHARQAGLLKP